MTSTDTKDIKKLTGESDWDAWIYDIEASMDTKGLLEDYKKFLEGKTIATTVLNGKDAKGLKSFVVKTVTGVAHQTMRGSADQTLFGILKALHDSYANQAMGSRMVHIDKLVNGVQQHGQTVLQFVNSKTSLLNEKLEGKLDPQEVLLTSVLRGCDRNLHSVSLPLLSKTGVTIAEVTQTLQGAENALNMVPRESSTVASVGNMAHADDQLRRENQSLRDRLAHANRVSGGGGKGKGRCSVCKTDKHDDASCWTQHPELKPDWAKGKSSKNSRARAKTASVLQKFPGEQFNQWLDSLDENGQPARGNMASSSNLAGQRSRSRSPRRQVSLRSNQDRSSSDFSTSSEVIRDEINGNRVVASVEVPEAL